MIAAGEVVERPASVIKELMENSFDAGARSVTVEIKGGGVTYLRVTDDGCGMAPEDAGVAFLRHATSKLSDERGLEAISTMGFRGEALAAISSVSRIELTTRQKGADVGTRVTLDAGDIQDMVPCGCPEGTTMIVRDIFFNTPARLKFLKTDRSEASACQLAALRCALGHPEVSVRFIRDGKEEFFSPGDGREESCAYSLLGREVASAFLPCTGENSGIRMHGFISAPAAARGNRSQQYFFCNQRFIKSQLLQAAVEQAYKNSLLVGRFPSCVIYLEMGYHAVDVNVHPAKTEVKFVAERQVYDTVYYAVLSALAREQKPVEVEISSSTTKAVASPSFYRTMTSGEFRSNGYSAGSTGKTPAPVPAPKPVQPARTQPVSAPASVSAPAAAAPSVPVSSPAVSVREPVPPQPVHEQITFSLSPEPPSVPSQPVKIETVPQDVEVPKPIVQKSVQNVEKSPLPVYRLVGEVLKTYIIVEVDGEMILIDKHACHEHMIFERLREHPAEIASQSRLLPVTLKLDGSDAEILDSNCGLLSELGFELEPFGTSEFIVRGVPADMDYNDIAPALEEICEKLHAGKKLSASDVRDEILHTVACKAAIKAGWNTEPAELDRLAAAVVSGKVRYCPHGRPVAVTLTRKELDKLFKRIV